MTLKDSEVSGRVPMPLRGTIPRSTGIAGRLTIGSADDNIVNTGDLSAPLSQLIKDSWTNPTTAAATAYISTGLTGAKMPNNSTLTNTRNATDWDGTYGNSAKGKPDFGRNVVVTVTHGSSIVACSGTVTGKDRYGRTITEAFTVGAGGTSTTVTGKVAFWQVDSITITAAGNATTNTLQLGTGAVLGLSYPLSVASAVKETSAGSVVTNGVFVKANTAVNNDRRGTYAPNSAPNNSTSYEVWYISDDPSML